MSKYFFSSLTRISDLAEEGFDVEPWDRNDWNTGDYVVGQVVGRAGEFSRVELRTGRMIEVVEGDLVVGAWGSRRATLEAVGDWLDIGDDGMFNAMTSAGLFGRVTSLAPLMPPLMKLRYAGHVTRDGVKMAMTDFIPPIPDIAYDVPTLLIIGTSMSAGKTTAAKRIIRHLKELGLNIVGTKLTGAGRYRDVLSMWDAGADDIYDFVDVGLPTTTVDSEEYRVRLRQLLSLVAARSPDLVVAEAGASPLEPYNGEVVLEELGDNVRCTVLCASDPYAVSGVIAGFGYEPDVVAGIATNTTASVELIRRLTGQKGFSFMIAEESDDAFAVIRSRLGL
ncbi:MAG: hypothetical protein U9R51_10730 [Actinomycetota bacterium]|nr:hypothetical protein [Actinomycetota bacterium]